MPPQVSSVSASAVYTATVGCDPTVTITLEHGCLKYLTAGQIYQLRMNSNREPEVYSPASMNGFEVGKLLHCTIKGKAGENVNLHFTPPNLMNASGAIGCPFPPGVPLGYEIKAGVVVPFNPLNNYTLTLDASGKSEFYLGIQVDHLSNGTFRGTIEVTQV